MHHGKQDHELPQDVTDSDIKEASHPLICSKCKKTKNLTAFPSNGKTQLKSGQIIRYRKKICRSCERIQRTNNGLCKLCGMRAKKGKKHCQKHLNLFSRNAKERNQKDKIAAFNHYGKQCAFCNQSTFIFLTIDHINNDGAEHRKSLRNGKNQGHNIYAWLRKNNYPKGFQTLCYNCNCAKNHYSKEIVLEAINQNPNRTTKE